MTLAYKVRRVQETTGLRRAGDGESWVEKSDEEGICAFFHVVVVGVVVRGPARQEGIVL